MMIKKNKLAALIFATLAPLSATVAKLEPEEKHVRQLKIITSFLLNHHYTDITLDDDKSKLILNQYIDYLDPFKSSFIKSEIELFKQYENSIDDYARNGELSLVYKLYETFKNKRQERNSWALERLSRPFSDNESGNIEIDREKIDWVNSEAELKQRWSEHLINEWIALRLADQNDEKARETLIERYQNNTKLLEETKSEDVFQMFTNALTSVYDPHTSYFSPQTSEDFDINMSLSLEGIGAKLSIEESVIEINELIAGGPAIQSGKLGRNDKILGVAQGKTGPIEDVVGWRLVDTVRLIRGKRGTIVRLRVEKALSGEITEVSLVRDKIKLEKSAAKSEIKTVKKNDQSYKIGIITLPSFYIDFEGAKNNDPNYRSTTRDVKKLIQDLKVKNIDGLMIDLRNNGGGSLSEVVDMTGLFIKDGPVVQVRNSDGRLTVHRDKDDSISYNGPLAVLINEYSASASEIFSGAIKDYGRGLILGEPTYGKGTVQTILGLDKFLPEVKDSLGQLKMTIAMFYRINGSSTQLKGVKPDLYVPNIESYTPDGESNEKHALPWSKIKKSNYVGNNQVKAVVTTLQEIYEKENANKAMMQNLLAMMEWKDKEKDKTLISLSLEERKARKDAFKSQGLEFENNFRALYGYPQLDSEYWSKKNKDKTDAEVQAEKDHVIDPVLSIATDAVADYVKLIKK